MMKTPARIVLDLMVLAWFCAGVITLCIATDETVRHHRQNNIAVGR